jgi:hypothetical protein
MRTVEYRIWGPKASPLRVEFPAELVRGMGIVEASGVLYGSRRGREMRVMAVGSQGNEEQEKVGVFVTRIRGEVFLTETDLAFFKEHQSEVALVVAGDRAGFFVREADGSIQTVRSHEEFGVARQHPDAPIRAAASMAAAPGELRLAIKRMRKWTPAGLVALAAIPIAALAVFPQHAGRSGRAGQQPAPSALEVHATGGQLRISWKPGQNAVLAIDDGGRRLAIPVYANQSNVTYAPRGSQVEVNLVTVDAKNQPRRESALYIASTGPSREP